MGDGGGAGELVTRKHAREVVKEDGPKAIVKVRVGPWRRSTSQGTLCLRSSFSIPPPIRFLQKRQEQCGSLRHLPRWLFCCFLPEDPYPVIQYANPAPTCLDLFES